MKSFKVYVKSLTWNRDSHQLFDFEHKSMERQSFTVESCSFFRRSDQVICVAAKSDGDCLIQVEVKEQQYRVSSNLPLWEVIRKTQTLNGRFRLRQGSVIKLGRFQYRVNHLKTSEDFLVPFIAARVKDPSLTCRICFIEDVTNDPLISVCKCAGSIQFIHVGCLQSWILSKLSPGDEDPSLKFLKSIYCELCRQKLPYLVRVDDQDFDMLKRFKPRVPFLILEGIQSENREPGVFFIGFQNKDSVMLGRGHESDVRIQDISVSRSHARLRFDGQDFFIEDNSSKFGTLVQVDSPLTTSELKLLQSGRTVFEISTTPGVTDLLSYEVDS
jgi:phosphatidylserine decarboxylase